MKILILGIVLAINNLVLGDQIDSLFSAIKKRDIKLDFNESGILEYWGWIKFQIEEVRRNQDQVGESPILFTSPAGIERKITIKGNKNLAESLYLGLVYFDLIAIFSENRLTIISDKIKIDMNNYSEISPRIFRESNIKVK